MLPASDLYGSNKDFMKLLSDGFLLKREDRNQKDLFIQLIDYTHADRNRYKIVNQLEITGYGRKRIRNKNLYINGLPFVVFEFKSAIREEATIHDAYIQLTVRVARRDIPELLKYNALCVISDGGNNKMGSLFAPYEFFYTWRKIDGSEKIEKDGINSLFTMIKGLFNKHRLRDVIRNFIFFPDSSKKEEKIVCRYPQYYAATKLYENICEHRNPERWTARVSSCFGATDFRQELYDVVFTRLLMKSESFASPTIVQLLTGPTLTINWQNNLPGQGICRG